MRHNKFTKDVYSLDSLKIAVNDPKRVPLELGWVLHRNILKKRGISVMEEDWDNLIILDACRFDLFVQCNHVSGELREVISKGSHTTEFLHENFDGSTHLDTVVVTAQPQYKACDVLDSFFETVPVWQSDWDEEIQTVHPKSMVAAVKQAEKDFPDKRIIAHFIQPHYPFIGQSGKGINHRSFTGDGVLSETDELSIWERLKNEELDKSTVWQAYRENLELTLPYVNNLVEDINGKTVITSDHGNAFGRYGVFGHPSRVYLEELVKVPWLEIDSDSRKQTVEEHKERSMVSDQEVESRLKDLGYV